MSNQYLEQAIATLSAQVTYQNAQIAELQKQLTDTQAAMSCELDALSASIQAMQYVNQSVSKSIQKSLQNINIEKEGLDSNHNAVRHKLDIGLKVGL
ncbi:hypothetical protein AB7229_00580 [Providencia stuartii]|uniref:hypothetical protein n=1 Tax=Providencia stuartii TaxID=588 RepID=UPI0034E436AB